MRNNEPRGRATPRASQLGRSRSRPRRRRCLTGVADSRPAPSPGRSPTLRPLAGRRSKTFQGSPCAASAPSPPWPSPCPHSARPPTAQNGPKRPARRLLPTSAPETPGAAPPRSQSELFGLDYCRDSGDSSLTLPPKWIVEILPEVANALTHQKRMASLALHFPSL
ncbi:uncharacterized protein [Manis javanica]|uniref:uncharacterized protein isoform X3 n=1 Tax=Manis javanica TaxID=9974 RepID=UPI003C6D5888